MTTKIKSSNLSSPIDIVGDLTIADRIVHSGDTNTAIRFPAADTVTVETNGVERLRVDSSGNVGIGTSLPISIGAGYTTLEVDGPTSGALVLSANGVPSFGFSADGTAAVLNARISGQPMRFFTNNDGTSAERMRIDNAGRVTMPYQPAFYLLSGARTGNAVNSTITITTGTAHVNTGSHYNTVNGRFTAPVAGVYAFTFWIARSNQAGSTPQFDILLNGTSTARSLAYTTSYSSGSVSVILQMSAGDYVNAQVFGSNGGTPDIYNAGFSGYLIG